MRKYTKRELQRLDVTFRKTREDEIEISIKGWTSGRFRRLFRVSLVNGGTQFTVAKEGRGGNFNLSYDYIMGNRPAVGVGVVSIYSGIYASLYRPGDDRHNEVYIGMIASAINEARLRLLKDFKR